MSILSVQDDDVLLSNWFTNIINKKDKKYFFHLYGVMLYEVYHYDEDGRKQYICWDSLRQPIKLHESCRVKLNINKH